MAFQAHLLHAPLPIAAATDLVPFSERRTQAHLGDTQELGPR